ncbi:MAG TPA: hypothetical protein PLA83_12935, partial [Deltaproteobacteria bacterium]|nr:hypothetical protein [Deltaproteobacteria bacterium]
LRILPQPDVQGLLQIRSGARALKPRRIHGIQTGKIFLEERGIMAHRLESGQEGTARGCSA